MAFRFKSTVRIIVKGKNAWQLIYPYGKESIHFSNYNSLFYPLYYHRMWEQLYWLWVLCWLWKYNLYHLWHWLRSENLLWQLHRWVIILEWINISRTTYQINLIIINVSTACSDVYCFNCSAFDRSFCHECKPGFVVDDTGSCQGKCLTYSFCISILLFFFCHFSLLFSAIWTDSSSACLFGCGENCIWNITTSTVECYNSTCDVGYYYEYQIMGCKGE